MIEMLQIIMLLVKMDFEIIGKIFSIIIITFV